jgi:hypothetical protein
LVALKLDTAFAPFSVSPPTELTVSSAPLIRPRLLSETVLFEVSDTLLLLPAATLPIILIAPVLLIEILPVPVSLIPVTVKGAAVFVREIPPPASVALKLVTVLALPKLVPVAEEVVSRAPLIEPSSAVSLIAPELVVRKILPAVLTLPVPIVTLPAAVAAIFPDNAVTLPLTNRLAEVAVEAVAMVIVPLVPVVVTVPFTSTFEFPTLPSIEILPLAWTVPPFSTSIPVLASAPKTFVSVEPLIVKFPLISKEPVLVTNTPPVFVLVSSANNVRSEPAPVLVTAPLTIMFALTDSVVCVVKLTVPRVRLLPPPNSVISP